MTNVRLIVRTGEIASAIENSRINKNEPTTEIIYRKKRMDSWNWKTKSGIMQSLKFKVKIVGNGKNSEDYVSLEIIVKNLNTYTFRRNLVENAIFIPTIESSLLTATNNIVQSNYFSR